MKSYVFYTAEGLTESPTGEIVDNLQILGFENGNTQKEALHNLMKNNEWIERCGFDTTQILAHQLETSV